MAAQIFRRLLSFVRWWFGLTWIIGGLVGIIWAPFAFAGDDGGWPYLLIGGVEVLIAGWVIHPWGPLGEGPRTLGVVPAGSSAGRAIGAIRRRRRAAGT